MATILDQILSDARADLERVKMQRPLVEIRQMLADAPPVRSLGAALRTGFGVIAEIKKKSPSIGPMRPDNAAEADRAYEQSAVVRAISVLTNERHFGMGLADLQRIRGRVTKPVLRKDFIFDEYQVCEARAFGADAILLMACVLSTEEMRQLADTAGSLGMEVLFEAHTIEEIRAMPPNARIIGINSRKFKISSESYAASREAAQRAVQSSAALEQDLSTDLTTFELVDHVPHGLLKVAESGVSADTVLEVKRHGFDAVLVGTSLLTDPAGVAAAVGRFERALKNDTAGRAPAPTGL